MYSVDKVQECYCGLGALAAVQVWLTCLLTATWLTLTLISSSAFHSTPSHFHYSYLPQLFYVFSLYFKFCADILQTP